MFDCLLISPENTQALLASPLTCGSCCFAPFPLPLPGFALFVFLLIWLFFPCHFPSNRMFFPLSLASHCSDRHGGSRPAWDCLYPASPFLTSMAWEAAMPMGQRWGWHQATRPQATTATWKTTPLPASRSVPLLLEGILLYFLSHACTPSRQAASSLFGQQAER